MHDQFNWPEGLPLPNPDVLRGLLQIQTAYDDLHTIDDDASGERIIYEKILAESIANMARTPALSLSDLIAKITAVLHITPVAAFEDLIAHASVHGIGDRQTLIASVFFDLFNGVTDFPRVPR